jgi:hypothetical protein
LNLKLKFFTLIFWGIPTTEQLVIPGWRLAVTF